MVPGIHNFSLLLSVTYPTPYEGNFISYLTADSDTDVLRMKNKYKFALFIVSFSGNELFYRSRLRLFAQDALKNPA